MKLKQIIILAVLLTSGTISAQARTIESCFKAAAKKHSVPLHLLLAVSYTESRFKPYVRGRNRNGTHDYGLMQINSIWSKQAKKMGHNWQAIKTDPCANIMFGSHILKYNRKRMGSWQAAVGAYNAGFGKTPKAKKRRQRYYRLVMRHSQVAQNTFKNVKAKIAKKG